MSKKKVSKTYRVIKWVLKLCYPKIGVEGVGNLPEEPALIIGNHSQLHGPIACEFYFPLERYTWCAAEMMEWKEVPSYAYRDFWSYKPGISRWLYKILSYLITPISVCIFNNANTIGVYRDTRVFRTFKETLKKLQEGTSVVIFPECDKEYNHIVYQFQEGFVDIAKLYHRKTGKELQFVPLYIAPNLKKMYLGKPIRFCADDTIEQERERICNYIMNEITQMASNLPLHTVVPYRNLPKRQYKKNKVREEM